MVEIGDVQNCGKEQFEGGRRLRDQPPERVSRHRKRARRLREDFESGKAFVEKLSGMKSLDKAYRVREVRIRRVRG